MKTTTDTHKTKLTVYKNNRRDEPHEVTAEDIAHKAVARYPDEMPPETAVNLACADEGSFSPSTKEYRTFETAAVDLLREERKKQRS